ncbi:MAG TPA: hypothetical protein VF855_08355 [Acidimicrobiales bacterium]
MNGRLVVATLGAALVFGAVAMPVAAAQTGPASSEPTATGATTTVAPPAVLWEDGRVTGEGCASDSGPGTAEATLTLTAATAAGDVVRSVSGFANAGGGGSWVIVLTPPSMVDVEGAEQTTWRVEATCSLTSASFRYQPWQATVGEDGSGPSRDFAADADGLWQPTVAMYALGGLVLVASVVLLVLLSRRHPAAD